MRSAQRDVSVAEAERLLAAVAGQKAAGREVADLSTPHHKYTNVI